LNNLRVLTSVPDPRAVRFEVGANKFKTSKIGCASFKPDYVINDILKNESYIQKLITNFVWKIKELADINIRLKIGKGFTYSLDSKASKLMSILFYPVYNYLDVIIKYVFKNQDLDKIIKNYDYIEIYTMCFKSEAYLYSSALRLRKNIKFRIDGIDPYYAWWLPTKCTAYESWGPLFTDSIAKKINKERIDERYYPLSISAVDIMVRNSIIIYGGSYSKVTGEFQQEILRKVKQWADAKNYNIIFKIPNRTDVSKEFLITENIKMVENIDNNFPGDYEKGLAELIHNALLFICFGPSHGVLEFGVNGIPALIINPKLYNQLKYNNLLIKAFSKAGVKVMEYYELNNIDNYLNNAINSRIIYPNNLKSIINLNNCSNIKSI
jgi:hypothetical protein